ncbi:hypothetical protein AL346_13910 [Chelatococcus sp. CO-6]|uniref:phage head closure protein n=2 Tax=unclassified Chelatococcus TaxID=2638111 RepID=UPI00069D66FA|nr:phage head closure protein [Chelatococcus sp. CO-6]ALA19728.1 hypothetical protein AL346_13910 [Chelatococcus sp. CO-6]
MADLPLGRLRHRAALLRPHETPDGTGGVVRAFEPAGHLWCSLDGVTAGSDEREHADRRDLAARFRAEMRWRDDVDGTCRFAIGGRSFAVLSAVDPDGHRRRLVCTLQEVTP